MIIRIFLTLAIFYMLLASSSARLQNPSGFAGPTTGYVTVGMMVVASIIIACLIWARGSFLDHVDD